MFEKEAEEWVKENMDCCKTDNSVNQSVPYFDEEERCCAKSAFQDGAEFGYNKALEEQGDKIESAYREGVAFGKGKLIEQMKCCANCVFSEEISRLDGTFCHKEGCYVMASGKCKLWEF